MSTGKNGGRLLYNCRGSMGAITLAWDPGSVILQVLSAIRFSRPGIGRHMMARGRAIELVSNALKDCPKKEQKQQFIKRLSVRAWCPCAKPAAARNGGFRC